MRDGWIASPTLIREGTAPRVISIVSGCGDYGRQPNAVVLWRGFTSATPRPRHELCGVPFWVPFHNVVTRDPNSAAASEPTPSHSITGVLAFAEERLIGHDRVVRMECPLVLDVGLI